MDLVFDLATELALLVDAAEGFALTMRAEQPTDRASLEDRAFRARLLPQRLDDSRQALQRYHAWCEEGPDA